MFLNIQRLTNSEVVLEAFCVFVTESCNDQGVIPVHIGITDCFVLDDDRMSEVTSFCFSVGPTFVLLLAQRILILHFRAFWSFEGQ